MNALSLMLIVNATIAQESNSRPTRVYLGSSGSIENSKKVAKVDSIIDSRPYSLHPKIFLESLESDELLTRVAQDYFDAQTIEEKVVNIYSYMQNDYNYVHDPLGENLIRKPIDTFYNGGDCEDLALLALEFFRVLNINSYFVLSITHAFTLVGPIDEEKLLNYLPKRNYDINGYYFNDDFYIYFDAAVKNGYPGYIREEFLNSAVIADVNSKEIVGILGDGLRIKEN